MTDVLERLRAADPVPAPVAYDDTVAQRNIDVIVRTDLTVRAAGAAPRRRHHAWWAAAAAAVVVVVGGAVVGTEVLRDAPGVTGPSSPPFTPSGSVAAVPWTTFSGRGVSFEYSTEWTSRPTGAPSTMSSAVAYLSSAPFPPVCTTGTAGGSGPSVSCHPPEPFLGDGGVFVDWTDDVVLSPQPLDRYSGTPVVLAGFEAKVDKTALPDECRPTAAVRGVLAAISTGKGTVLTMTACIGPGDVDADLAAVDRMLASVRIDR
ncbi:hypothetical protein ACXR2U_15515 [Jatrophihabitans sp. YIM 134969]